VAADTDQSRRHLLLAPIHVHERTSARRVIHHDYAQSSLLSRHDYGARHTAAPDVSQMQGTVRKVPQEKLVPFV
jgi:hypothetical protein